MTAARYLTTPDAAAAAVAALVQQPLLVIDTETQPRPQHRAVQGAALDPYYGQPRLIQAGTLAGDVVVFDLHKVPLQTLLPLAGRPWVGHNLKFDLKMLHAVGMPLPPECHDTMLLARVISGLPRPYSLQQLAEVSLGVALDKAGQTSDWSAPVLTAEQLRYAVEDVRATARIYNNLRAELDTVMPAQVRFYDLLRRVLPVVARQELVGVPFDWQRCAELLEYHSTRAEAVETELQHWHDRERPNAPPLNTNSPAQVAALLQQQLPQDILQRWPRTESGQLATDADALSLLDAAGELGQALQMLKMAKKHDKIATALRGYTKARHPVTNRLHPAYAIAGAVSGRFTCAAPNLQNPPRDAAVRALVRPAAGQVLVNCDLASIELRTLAMVAPEPTLRAALVSGQDIHRMTAAAMANKHPDAVTSEERSRAKAVVFGSMYGQKPAGLVTYARESFGVQLTEAEASQQQAMLWRAFPGMPAWQADRRLQVSGSLQAVTVCGNLRRFTPYEFAANAVLAHEVSGAAAEVLLHALAHLPAVLPPGAELVHHVHDEVLVLCAEQQRQAVCEAVEAALRHGWLQVFPDAPDMLRGLAVADAVPYWCKDPVPLGAPLPPLEKGTQPAPAAAPVSAPAAPAVVHRVQIPDRMTPERMAGAMAATAAPPDYGVLLYYVRERERVQQLKAAGQAAPWTEDAVIAGHRFCCNQREHDRLTVELHRHHRQPHDGTRFDWLGVILGRLTNTAELFQALTDAGAWPADSFNPQLIAATLAAAQEQGAKFTSAYRVPVVQQWMQLANASNHAQTIPHGALQLALQVEPQLRAAATMQQAVGVLQQVPGLGDFFGSQVAIDLRWMQFGSAWPDRDSWAHAGPGAQLGLAMLHRRGQLKGVPQPWALARMRELQQVVHAELGMQLILTDVQNACGCEFSKYARGWSGGHMKRKYGTSTAKRRPPKAAS